jgi:heat shock protein HtpX
MSKFVNNIKTVLLLGILTGLILVCGQLIGGRQGLIIALVMAGVMNFVSFFFSAKIALAAMRAQEVGPEHPLYKITEELAMKANMPMPRVYVSPHAAPNAFATGRGPRNAAVCATQGLLRMLNRNEIAGVMAHELAHVKHRDILIQSIAVTIGAAISYLGYMFMFTGGRNEEGEGANPIAGLLVLLLGPIAAGILQAAISRQREYAADTEGANICGDPMYLATALEKIHLAAHRIPMDTNPAFNAMMIAEPKNLMQSIGNLFATHPPLEKRLTNLIGRTSTGMRFAL